MYWETKEPSRGTVLIDVDEVLTPTVSKVLDIYNIEQGSDVTIEQVQQYRLNDNPVFKTDVVSYFCRQHFFRELPLNPHAYNLVRGLHEAGYDIIFATAVCKGGYDDRHNWLKKHFPFVPERNYMFGARKDLLQADWIIDDYPENLLGSPCLNKICPIRPWNQKDKRIDQAGIKRVRSLSECLHYILFSTKTKECVNL